MCQKIITATHYICHSTTEGNFYPCGKEKCELKTEHHNYYKSQLCKSCVEEAREDGYGSDDSARTVTQNDYLKGGKKR